MMEFMVSVGVVIGIINAPLLVLSAVLTFTHTYTNYWQYPMTAVVVLTMGWFWLYVIAGILDAIF